MSASEALYASEGLHLHLHLHLHLSASGSRARDRDREPSAEQLKWEEGSERAAAQIFLHLGDRAQKHVLNLRDPVAIWKG